MSSSTAETAAPRTPRSTAAQLAVVMLALTVVALLAGTAAALHSSTGASGGHALLAGKCRTCA